MTELTWDEALQAAIVGVQRHAKAKKDNRQNYYGEPDDEGALWNLDINAACAEKAYAKMTGRYWAATTDPDKHLGDVGGQGVRSTDKPNGCLILHPRDEDDRVFVLMVGSGRHWEFRGSIVARKGKQLGPDGKPRWWRTNVRTPAYFVPQSELDTVLDLAGDEAAGGDTGVSPAASAPALGPASDVWPGNGRNAS